MGNKAVEAFMANVVAKNPSEPQFHQAVREVVESILPVVETNPVYREAKILERIVEPERIISFRVPWLDDKSQVQVNRGYRVSSTAPSVPTRAGCGSTPA